MTNFYLWLVLAIVGAIAATILSYIFIIPAKKKDGLNKIGKILHDIFNFKSLLIEKILKALYVFATALVVILGAFLIIFGTLTDLISRFGNAGWSFMLGIILLILGPIAVRLIYELVMITIILVKNVIEINNKLKNQTGETVSSPFETQSFEFPKKQAAEPTVPKKEYVYCPSCGEVNEKSTGTCKACGAHWKV